MVQTMMMLIAMVMLAGVGMLAGVVVAGVPCVVVADDAHPPITVIRRMQPPSGEVTDHDRANLRSGWISPVSAVLIAFRYLLRASPSLTRFANECAPIGEYLTDNVHL